jgi:DNA polymerase-3 subunit delta
MVYLIYGTQYPIVSKRVKKVIHSILGDQYDEFSYVRFNGKQTLVQDIVYECDLIPLDGKKVIRVDEPYFLLTNKERNILEKEQNYNTLIHYIEHENENVNLIFVVETNEINKKNNVFKAIEKNGKIIYEEGLDAASLEATGALYFQKKGCFITKEALSELLNRIGNDVSLFIKEAEKLSLYSKNIEKKDVEELVSIPLEQNAFNICEHLINHKINLALKVYQDLITLKEEPVRLLNLLSSQFRMYTQIAYLYQMEHLTQDQIAAKLKIHPYRVKISCRNLVNLKYQELVLILDYLYQLDVKIKGMEITPNLGIELFILNFNSIKQLTK